MTGKVSCIFPSERTGKKTNQYSREISKNIYPQKKRTIAIITVRDITERKSAEEALFQSEQRYRTVFDNMQEGFVFCQMIYDTSGKPDDWIYLNVNPAFNRLTGLADIVGRRVTDAIPGIKDQTPELFKTYSRVAQTGQPEKFEIHFTPLGIWLSISVFSPEKEYFVAVFDDITIRKQVEEKLRMSGEKFRLLVECAPHAIYIQTRSRFTYLNPEALRLFGASSPDELLAKLVIERFSPEDYAIVEDRIRLLNIAAEQLFGWSEAEIIGKTVSYTPPEKRLEYEAIQQRIRSGEAIRGIELQRVTKDGR